MATGLKRGIKTALKRAIKAAKKTSKAAKPTKKAQQEPCDLSPAKFEEAYEAFRKSQKVGNFPKFSELGERDRAQLHAAAVAAFYAAEAELNDFQKCVRVACGR